MNFKLFVTSFIASSTLIACGGKVDKAPVEQHESEGANAAAEHARVELSAAQIQASGVTLETAGPASIRETLPVYGVIAPNAERVRGVAARFPGVVRDINRKIGDAVRKGDSLATVESNESLQTYPLVAPLDGVIIARNANPGEQSGDRVLFTVADLSTVWVELSLFPRDVGKVKVGQSVRVTSADTGRTGDGKIVYVAPFGSSANQTLSARVLLDNKERTWSPGLYVTAHVTLAESEVPLAARASAIQEVEEQNVIFVQEESGFEPRPVNLGRTDGIWIEVISGLKAGDSYVANNSFILKAELGKGSAEHGH
jgi:cobalt-zinc-cadmium efflux system membrane fusion protein